MPHIVVKMYEGRSHGQKHAMVERISDAMQEVLGYGPEAVSVAIEEIAPARWMPDVYDKDILPNQKLLYKRPGYGPLAESA